MARAVLEAPCLLLKCQSRIRTYTGKRKQTVLLPVLPLRKKELQGQAGFTFINPKLGKGEDAHGRGLELDEL